MQNKNQKFWFSADHHFDHANIIKFCKRPFKNVEEMNNELIERHNLLVGKEDIVVIGGDFSFANKEKTFKEFIANMNGKFIFLNGSHDRWLGKTGKGFHEIWKKKIGNYYIVVCHYAMASWPRSHFNSYHLYGHHHGNLSFPNKSMDIGVDTNHYFPYSLEEVINIINKKPHTLGLVRKSFGK